MSSAALTIKIWTAGRQDRIPVDLSDLADRFAPHCEHVTSLCKQGYQSGEIVDEKFSGWWSIERNDKSVRRKRRRK